MINFGFPGVEGKSLPYGSPWK